MTNETMLFVAVLYIATVCALLVKREQDHAHDKENGVLATKLREASRAASENLAKYIRENDHANSLQHQVAYLESLLSTTQKSLGPTSETSSGGLKKKRAGPGSL